jgi:hypothetical protein
MLPSLLARFFIHYGTVFSGCTIKAELPGIFQRCTPFMAKGHKKKLWSARILIAYYGPG